MGDEANFFAMPPSEEAPAPAPEGGDEGEMMMGFAAPAEEDIAVESTPDEGSVPASDAPIILGGSPPEEEAPFGAVEDVDDDEEEVVAESGEPSAMTKWNAEWQETLQARKEAENAKKAEMIEAAKLSMENFNKEREQKRETKMAKNREDEQAKLEAIEADLENDNSWQRVCKMVELTHDGTGDSEDTKRMRDVLILLKNDPTRASAVGA
jgi:hypothetical protein